MKLSAIVLTKNEEKNIEKCLSSLSFVDEIIVIDDFSTDKTVKLTKNYGAIVFFRRLNNNFAQQRNYALSKARGEWVLFIDADEVVSVPLKNEIIQAINNPFSNIVGFYLKRKDIIWGKKLNFGETGKVKFLRLAKKNTGKWKRSVHEFWCVRGIKGDLHNELYHYPHPSLKEFIKDINFQSDLHSSANYWEGKKSNVIKITFWPMGKFFNNWIMRWGFLDGSQGLIIALMMSLHSFLAWSKLWILQRK
jgi:glycosyltransferase involved in cell wall biosynthesis